jgi:hypothetical protein
MARKPFILSDATREKVRYLAGVGVPQDAIAKIVGCAPKTLRKRCRMSSIVAWPKPMRRCAAICSRLPKPAISRRSSSR